MSELGYPVFDADNHYYEAEDAFTRHVPAEMQARCVQWVEMGGRKHHLVGGKIAHAVKNPTWNPIAMPGAMYEYFRGNPDNKDPFEMMRKREPLPDYYMDPDARLKKMDEQDLEAMWLFPTLGVLYEELLKNDTEAVLTTFRAFNRWVDEDWGVAYKNRIFGAPYITLADVDWACEELEWALGRGARVVVMRPSAVWNDREAISPTNTKFDPFWARVNEAGITVVVHAGDSGYTSNGYATDGFSADIGKSAGDYGPSVKGFGIERAAYDWLITMAYGRMFERFPNLRIASVENGSEYLADLFRKLGQAKGRMRGYFKEDPGDLFREHVWINPFWEDDVNEVVHHMGPDRVIFGSDWPHIEGMPQPLDYLKDVAQFDDAAKQKIMRDNTRFLNELRPA
jgi:predicted TIM-barrel fold metal-dependent hydrolase